MDNVLPQYMYDNFHLDLHIAGLLAAIFGMMNLFSRPSGGFLSDWVAKKWGMRGRIWALWIVQTLGGLFCLLLGITSHSLGATMAILVIFSIFCQQSCGLSFGIVPFVSKRSTGLVSGFVGSGGNAGGAITQAIFFTYLPMSTPQGFMWMGVMVMGVTLLYLTMYFPMWGGAFAGAKEGVNEEDYYLAEWTPEERAQVSSAHGRGAGKAATGACMVVLDSRARVDHATQELFVFGPASTMGSYLLGCIMLRNSTLTSAACQILPERVACCMLSSLTKLGWYDRLAAG